MVFRKMKIFADWIGQPDLSPVEHVWVSLWRAIVTHNSPSENPLRPENNIAERVGLVTTGTHKLPLFQKEIIA